MTRSLSQSSRRFYAFSGKHGEIMATIELEAFIDETIAVSAQKAYYPTTFIGMRQRHGTVDAISRLVISGDVQSGFSKLNRLGLLDYTIEAAVLKFPTEFSKQAQECAAFRLRMVQGDKPGD
jgi:hypothetical protein